VLIGYKSEAAARERSAEKTTPGQAAICQLNDGTFVGLGAPQLRTRGAPRERMLFGMAGTQCWESEARQGGLLGRQPTLSSAVAPATHQFVAELQSRGWKTKNILEVAVGLLAALDRLQPGESLALGRAADDTPTAHLVPTPAGATRADDWDTAAAQAIGDTLHASPRLPGGRAEGKP
jgi:hypothetical protein